MVGFLFGGLAGRWSDAAGLSSPARLALAAVNILTPRWSVIPVWESDVGRRETLSTVWLAQSLCVCVCACVCGWPDSRFWRVLQRAETQALVTAPLPPNAPALCLCVCVCVCVCVCARVHVWVGG